MCSTAATTVLGLWGLLQRTWPGPRYSPVPCLQLEWVTILAYLCPLRLCVLHRDYLLPCLSQGMSPGGHPVSSEFSEKWPLTVNCSSLPIAKFFRWHHCCFCCYSVAIGSMKLTGNGTDKSWKGTSAFLLRGTSVFTREKTASITSSILVV